MKKGIERANMDFNVNLGEDFYEYANGGWRRENPLEKRPEFSRYGKFDALAQDARKKLRDLVENVGNDPEAKIHGTDAQK
ncbi:MAG: M13 family metallopeptidase, partial [Muribaculaceae bacterium]|nr:M13 family metallopeptidase [Muribaculaceae bacterium]